MKIATSPLTSRSRWWILIALCLAALVFAASALGWSAYAASWVGAVFRAASGGTIGFLVSRYVVKLDLSCLDPEERAVAGLSQSLLIAGFALAVATGA